MSTSYGGHSLDEFLGLVAAREPAPGGGAVAAVTVSLAASLVTMAARYSVRQFPAGAQVVADAGQWRRRALRLADDDAQAYRAVIAAYEATHGEAPADRRERLRLTLRRAAEVPLEITVVGVATARAGAALVTDGNNRVVGDGAAGVLLADAAVRSAAHLVTINVRNGGCDEELVRQATRNVELSADAVRSVETVLRRSQP